MSGKCRASLRAKVLRNVDLSDLSQTDKGCIHAVFDRFDSAAADLISAMTDNEIIKALELIKSDPNCDMVYGRYISTMTLDDTLNFINHQKAEIEMLEAEIDKQYEQARADILGNMADGGTSCHWCIEEHRARAIKEFAERLKENSTKTDLFCNETLVEREYKITEDELDNLVKEMVGEG